MKILPNHNQLESHPTYKLASFCRVYGDDKDIKRKLVAFFSNINDFNYECLCVTCPSLGRQFLKTSLNYNKIGRRCKKHKKINGNKNGKKLSFSSIIKTKL